MTQCAKNSLLSNRRHFYECASGSLKNRRRFLFLRADWFAVISRTLLCFPSSPDSISIQILLKRLSAEPELWRSPVFFGDGCNCGNLLSLPCMHAHSLEMLLRFDWIVWRRRPTRTHSHTFHNSALSLFVICRPRAVQRAKLCGLRKHARRLLAKSKWAKYPPWVSTGSLGPECQRSCLKGRRYRAR